MMAEDARDLADEKPPSLTEALAAYQLLMDEIVPESQYWRGKRENTEKVAYLGNIIERAAARRREEERREGRAT